MSVEYDIKDNTVIYKLLAKKDRRWQMFVELFDSDGKPLDIWDSNLMSGNYDNDFKAVYYTVSGKVDHKQKKSVPREIASGKVSRTKGRNVLTEAMTKALSKYTRKINRENFHLETEDAKEVFEPMLLQKYEPGRLKDGSYVQPKFDGVRAYTTYEAGKMTIMSRKKLEWKNIPEIVTELEEFYVLASEYADKEDLHLDGEVYNHGVPFDEVSGAMAAKDITAEQKEILDGSSFILFDLRYDSQPDIKFGDRISILKKLFKLKKWDKLVLCPTFKVADDADVQQRFSKFLDLGFEGAVVKADAPYMSGSRSSNAMKLKRDEEAEFVIIGYSTGEGSSAGSLKLKLKAPNGKEFDQMYIGTRGKSQELYKDFQAHFDEKYLNTKITLRFRFMNKNGKPEHVRATSFRVDV